MQLLARALPGQINYFLSYVMILSLAGFSMALWRPGPLIVRFIFQKFLAKTKRAFRKAEGPYSTALHVGMAMHLIVFIIVTGSTCCCVWRFRVFTHDCL